MFKCKYEELAEGDLFITKSLRWVPLIVLNGSSKRIDTKLTEALEPSEEVWKVVYPFRHTAIHEAGHFVYSLRFPATDYDPQGIFFDPYLQDTGCLVGSWKIARPPALQVQLSLAGLATQLKICPESFSQTFKEAITISSIFGSHHPKDELLSLEEKFEMKGAKTDYEHIWAIGKSESNPVVFLLEQERIVRGVVEQIEFQKKVNSVATSILSWLKNEGREKWIEAFELKLTTFVPKDVLLSATRIA